MKIQKFTENSSEITPPEMKDFAEWCLKTKKYFYDRNINSWFDRKLLTKFTWDNIYLAYKAKKYNL